MKAAWLTILASLLSTCATGQRTIHVPGDAPTIQAGIDAAADGDTVLVAPGTYIENISFKGKNITVTSGAVSYQGAAATVLTGKTDGPVVSFSDSEPQQATLNGFTIESGFTHSASVHTGGGVYLHVAAGTITNNVIRDNIGCGVGVVQASATITGNHIVNNRSGAGIAFGYDICRSYGYGIDIEQALNVTITDNVIEGNRSSSDIFTGTQSSGGGIYALSAQYVLLKTTESEITCLDLR